MTDISNVDNNDTSELEKWHIYTICYSHYSATAFCHLCKILKLLQNLFKCYTIKRIQTLFSGNWNVYLTKLTFVSNSRINYLKE
mgnify:CR=1 FL=1